MAQVLEGLMGLAAKSGHLRTRTGPRDASLRKARACYNHLAGDMGIQMFDSFVSRGFLDLYGENLLLTETGSAFAQQFGIDVRALQSGKAPLCKECLDWSARRSHLAGSLGRAMLSEIESRSWARRSPTSRAVLFTVAGEKSFRTELLGEG